MCYFDDFSRSCAYGNVCKWPTLLKYKKVYVGHQNLQKVGGEAICNKRLEIDFKVASLIVPALLLSSALPPIQYIDRPLIEFFCAAIVGKLLESRVEMQQLHCVSRQFPTFCAQDEQFHIKELYSKRMQCTFSLHYSSFLRVFMIGLGKIWIKYLSTTMVTRMIPMVTA